MIFPTVRSLSRALRAEKRRADIAESTLRALQHLSRCTNPATHLRLAHQLEQAQARLGERDGIDPHLASIRLVREDVE